jgi:hypothetical protein
LENIAPMLCNQNRGELRGARLYRTGQALEQNSELRSIASGCPLSGAR